MRAGARISVMLAQVQDQPATRNLAVKRPVCIEAVILIDRKAEETEIELICLGDVEDAQYRDDGIKPDVH
jgi:hypothetical protein